MKITIINGSPRKNGNTAKVLKTMAARLTELGCEHIEYIDLVDCKITPCIGCAACYKTGSCVIHDDAEMINGHIAGSQGVIIGSPTYVSNVSGFLKTYIDRGHIVLEQSYRSKRVLPIVTYGVSGGGKVIKMLKNTIRYAGGGVVGSAAIRIGPDQNPLDDPRITRAIAKTTSRLYEAILRDKPKSLFDTLIHTIAGRHVIRPRIIRSPEHYAAVIGKYM